MRRDVSTVQTFTFSFWLIFWSILLKKVLSSINTLLFTVFSYVMVLALQDYWMQLLFYQNSKWLHIGMNQGTSSLLHLVKNSTKPKHQLHWNPCVFLLQWFHRCIRCGLLHPTTKRIYKSRERTSCRNCIKRTCSSGLQQTQRPIWLYRVCSSLSIKASLHLHHTCNEPTPW